jgi:hypothetical protein
MPVPAQNTLRLVRRVQTITIAWMSIEAALSLWSAWRAKSPALAAFGGDSAVELLSAIIVMRRFRRGASAAAEKRAAQMAGVLLFILAACVVSISALCLLGFSESRPSYLGMAVLFAAALIMPWLTAEKRRLSALTRSAALRADAAESAVCFYLSLGRPCGPRGPRDLESRMGRSGCRTRNYALHSAGGAAGRCRQTMQLLLTGISATARLFDESFAKANCTPRDFRCKVATSASGVAP